MNKIAIIGGGAAGMMAAIAAARNEGEVTIFERNSFLGKKLAITGKGRCNLTNACTIQEMIKNVPGNGSFLYSALHRLSPEAAMAFFREIGLELKMERGRRVFPVEDDAHVVVNALKRELRRLEVDVLYNSRVHKLGREQDRVTGVWVGEDFYAFDRVIIATGGMSYPATGSTGDGYRLASQGGHTIVPPQPSLVPLETAERWVETVSGLSLKNVAVVAQAGGKVVANLFGEMLFTHFGVSGPLILSLSPLVCPLLAQQEVTLRINMKPALSPEQLEQRLQRDFLKFSRKQYHNALTELLPASLIPVMVELSGIPGDKPVNQITREERQRLKELLQGLPLTVTRPRPLEEAVITAGGVRVKEVDPRTMASKLVKGLYFAGEVLDVDALTGGYNLQVAWSTGYVAGWEAAQ